MASIDRAIAFAERHHAAVLAGALAALTALAWSNRFIQDDAFISFRYARNLSDGFGLVWNPGEPVEGYTNFLWTLLMVVPFRLSIDPVLFSHAVGLTLHPLALLLTARMTWLATASKSAALLAALLLGTNYTFSAYATGGLETVLHVVLLLSVMVLLLAVRRVSSLAPGRLLTISLLSAAAIMTRMDSVLPLAVGYGYLGIELWREGRSTPRALSAAALWLLAPGALVVMAWLGWKLHFYGDILPNTYYAKLNPASQSWLPGLRFIWTFVSSYWLLPVLALALALLRPGLRAWRSPLGLLACTVLIWCAYVVRIGGDFMEFRLLVPALPAAFALLSWLLVTVSPWRTLSLVAGLLVIAGSLHHARSFELVHHIEPVPLLNAHVEEPPYLWAQTGRVLGDLFGDSDRPPRIAVIAAGAVPYYSSLPSIDMLGLNDPWIARHGISVDPELVSPGHNRLATFDYLVERDVHLVLGNPWVSERKPGLPPRFGTYGLIRFGVPTPAEAQIPAEARMQVLEINLDEGHRLYALYLMGSERVDEVVRREKIRTHPVKIRRRPRQGR